MYHVANRVHACVVSWFFSFSNEAVVNESKDRRRSNSSTKRMRKSLFDLFPDRQPAINKLLAEHEEVEDTYWFVNVICEMIF